MELHLWNKNNNDDCDDENDDNASNIDNYHYYYFMWSFCMDMSRDSVIVLPAYWICHLREIAIFQLGMFF